MIDKQLSDLSKLEIGRLFPIIISSYNDNWPNLFEKEKQLISNTLEPSMFSRLEHFGSTSVRGLSAKDTIDILMEIDFEETKSLRLIEQMKGLGYEFNWQNEGSHTYMMFVKGYSISSPKGQTYHIHAGPKNHPIWDRLLFRDYLINHPEEVKAYTDLKKRLSIEFKEDRVKYRISKTEFIMNITEKAKSDIKENKIDY